MTANRRYQEIHSKKTMPLAFLKLLHIIKNKLECGNNYGNKASRDAVLGGQREKHIGSII